MAEIRTFQDAKELEEFLRIHLNNLPPNPPPFVDEQNWSVEVKGLKFVFWSKDPITPHAYDDTIHVVVLESEQILAIYLNLLGAELPSTYGVQGNRYILVAHTDDPEIYGAYLQAALEPYEFQMRTQGVPLQLADGPGIRSDSGVVIVANSERDLEHVLNTFTLPANWAVRCKGGIFVLAGLEGGVAYSPEAQAVFDRMPVEPDETQKNAIARFVDNEHAVGNWTKLDEFYLFTNAKGWVEANALTGWKLKTATKGTTPPVLEALGFKFDGAATEILTGYNPSIDAINFAVASSFVGIYVPEFVNDADGGFYGSQLGSRTRAKLNVSGLNHVINSSGNSTLSFEGKANPFGHYAARGFNDGVSKVEQWGGGEFKFEQTMAQTILTTDDLPIGQAVGTGTFLDGYVCAFAIGGGDGFDIPTHYANLLQLLADFDVFVQPVLDRMPQPLASGEEEAIRTFVNAEVVAGNWHKTDEFFCFALTDPLNREVGFLKKTGVMNDIEQKTEGIRTKGVSGSYFNTNFRQADFLKSDIETDVAFDIYQIKVVDIDGTCDIVAMGVSPVTTGHYFRDSQPTDVMRYSAYGSRRDINGAAHFRTPHLLTVERRDATVGYLVNASYRNGPAANVYAAQPDGNYQVGANGTVGNNNNTDGVFATLRLGAAKIDTAAHLTNVANLLGDLEAERIFRSMPNPGAVTVLEKVAIRNFIREEIKAGNYYLTDEIILPCLTDPANANYKWKAGGAMTLNNVTHTPGGGWNFAGDNTSYVDSLINPQTLDNWVLDSAFFTFFPNSIDNADGYVLAGLGHFKNQFRYYANGTIGYSLNQNESAPGIPNPVWGRGVWSCYRKSTATQYYAVKDGVQALQRNNSPDSIGDNLEIGRRNNVEYFQGQLSFFAIGGGDGFDPTQHHDHINTMLSTLGVL